MEIYNDFAQIYDKLMNDIDYSAMADYYCDVFDRYDKKPRIVLDLGCGTGSLTIELAKRGFEMIGVDCSIEMLSIANQKAGEEGLDIIFLKQDMAQLKLFGSVQAVVSSMDCINYITSPKKLQKVFERIAFHLEPGGIFAFDINSAYKIGTVLGNNTFTYDGDDAFYVWENKFNKKNLTGEYMLTFFVPNEGKYYRIDELHRQRIYYPTELGMFAGNANMTHINTFDFMSFQKPKRTSHKLFLIMEK